MIYVDTDIETYFKELAQAVVVGGNSEIAGQARGQERGRR